jgi:trehalose 6-phosphate synthase
VTRPASGLVTGVEPILRACGGTWIAHGGGSADRACSDAGGRVAVPPEKPDYVLRRLWIADEEYEKYYSGFANEALWPLCHLAYTQPVFRSGDWSAYQSVNRAFARAAVEETGDSGFVLVQDYHFALAPRMIRERAPQLVTSIFWHIPWPNWEVIGICPWKEALLDGMLGADIVGLQTRQHCLNFLEAAERFVRCRVNREEMTVEAGGHLTRVRAYPISVEWPYPSIPRAEGKAVRRSLGIGEEVHVSLGVDRADYTKGLIERVAAIEHLLEEHPALAGRYVHVQLASPTRSGINRYRQLSDELQREVDRVNDRFATAEWKPIVLQMRTFSCEDVRRYYSMANSALVTPLHDGMNLVAKEYVASCQDEDGLLVLSTFAGAAKELAEALLVNPYDTGQVARAILRAIRMPADERRSRMAALRNRIARNSIYDWAAGILRDMCAVRSPKSRRWLRPISARDVDRAVEAAV